MSEEELLQQGIAAARKRHKAEAWRLLAQVLHMNQRNEMAWFWLSGVVDSDEQRIKCLENVLVLNPNNAPARKGLAQLQARTGAVPETSQPDAPPPMAPCPHCGAMNRSGARFCKECGDSLGPAIPVPAAREQMRRCKTCGSDNRVGEKFCIRCGQRLDLTGPPAAPAAVLAVETGPAQSDPPGKHERAQRLFQKSGALSAVASAPPELSSATTRGEADTHKEKSASARPSPGPAPAALRIAGFFLLVTAGTWVVSAIMAIGFGDLAAIVGVWNLLVCGAIVIVAIQLFQGNAKLCSAASDLFKTNLFLMNGQIMLFGETLDETMLALDVIGLVALGIQAAILWLGKKRIKRWWQARQRVKPAG